jgi:uncharacterized cupin superfamily protein
MKKIWISAAALTVATGALAATMDSDSRRVIRLAPSDPAASTDGDHVLARGTHLTFYSFKAPGAQGLGLSLLDGPYYPITAGGSAEIFYVYDGSGIITQANGHDVPVHKGDIVFIPRGVAYGGKDFIHYKHAFIVFDPGKVPVADGPTEVTVLHPQQLGTTDFEPDGPQKVHVYYHGGDGSTVQVRQSAGAGHSDTGESQVNTGEYSVVLKGSITVTSSGGTVKAHVGDVFFIPKGTKVSYTSQDLQTLTVDAVARVRDQ